MRRRFQLVTTTDEDKIKTDKNQKIIFPLEKRNFFFLNELKVRGNGGPQTGKNGNENE